MMTAATTDPLAVAVSVSNLVVGVGTLVTVIVAVATLRSQIQERQLDQIRNVRAWLDWERVGKEVEGRPDLDEHEGLGVIRNGSDAPIYRLRYRVLLGSPKRPPNVRTKFTLLPGDERTTVVPERYSLFEIDRLESDRANVPGIELAYTDASGRRWHRHSDGSLKIVKGLRWYAPWRSVPSIDYDVLALRFWTHRANWQYREDLANHRGIVSGPPPWFAFDIRWERWRTAAKELPVTIPWWKWRERRAAEYRICQERIESRPPLPLPWWARRQRKVYAKRWRRSVAEMNRHLER